MYDLKLTYPDTTTFIVGSFASEAEADAWIAAEQAKNNWIDGTTWTITFVPKSDS